MKLILSLILFITIINISLAKSNSLTEEDSRIYSADHPEKGKIIFIGNFYVAPQSWSKLQADSGLGFGVGGMAGVGLQIENMVLGLGPHFGMNRWQDSFFKTVDPNPAINTYDLGGEADFCVEIDKTKVSLTFGAGKALFDSPDEDKFTNIGIRLGNQHFFVAPTFVNYYGGAKDLSRLELRLGANF
jgi:hypothetical protein